MGTFYVNGDTHNVAASGSGNQITIGLTGITQYSLQVGGAANALTQLGVASNGQLPIGSTGADPVLATITPGANTSITNGVGSITIGASQAIIINNYSIANFTPYIVASTDYYITVDTSAIAITIQLPNAPTQYQVFIIKDSAGNAATQNITVTTVGGLLNIDAAATFVMNTNWQSIHVLYDGFGYQVF